MECSIIHAAVLLCHSGSPWADVSRCFDGFSANENKVFLSVDSQPCLDFASQILSGPTDAKCVAEKIDFLVRASGSFTSRQPPGLGDMVASGLSALGITKERVSKLAGGDCGCQKRQDAMNDIGARYLGIGRVDPPA